MDKSKPFGLIISKRAQSYKPTVSTVFGSDSDDESVPKKKKMPSIPQAKPKKRDLPEASEDPSIYEYDSIYDDMKAQEVAKVAPKDANKPSKYIESLLKAADKRKKDQERRVEKKVHHERELEGDKFKDKEAFVTSAYKKKMQEMEEEEERERRENMLNEMMDVTKQKDLSGFYRHFLKQSVGEEAIPVFGERHAVKTEDVKEEDVNADIKQENVSEEEGTSKKKDGKDRRREVDDDKRSKKKPSHGKDHRRKDVGADDEDISGPALKASFKDGKREDIMETSKRTRQESDSDDEEVVSKLKESKKSNRGDCDDQKKKDVVPGDEEGSSETAPRKESVGQAAKSTVDANVDRDTDTDSSSDEEATVAKGLPKKWFLKHIPKYMPLADENVDSDSDLISSSKDNDPQPGSNTTMPEDDIDKDSDIVSDDDDPSGSEANLKELLSLKGDFHGKRKRSPNTDKPSRNIRKRVVDADDSSSQSDDSSSGDEKDEESKNNKGGESDEEATVSETVVKADAEPPKPKIDIYAKRTVGDVFADAQARYFQRMAARSA